MKKIYLLVLKAFIRPFIVTFFIVMFVLLMLFLFKYIDDLIGKGFEWYVILQLMWYASATNVAMALPLAMLLSSIMTFGTLGENYELVAIKSSGVSLQRAMMPLIVSVGLMSIGAFLFSDYMLPVANLKMGSLLYDVRNQKAAFLIEEGIFNNSIRGYSIKVNKKDKDGQTLHGVLIYENSPNTGSINTLMAKTGKMYRSADDQYLILKLYDGVRYEESSSGRGVYDPRKEFKRYRFKETEQKFDLSDFKMKRTDENLFKSNYAMLNTKQLRYYRDSTQHEIDSNVNTIFNNIKYSYRYFLFKDTVKHPVKIIKNYTKTALDIVPKDERVSVLSNAQSELSSIKNTLSLKAETYTDYQQRIRRYIIEYQRKFTLSVSCLILFSVGAPLGAIIRKGGLGLPVVMSIIFFLIYHIISTIGEKSAKQGDISPILGMWIAIVVLAPMGMFLTYKATVDSALFDIEAYKRFFQKLFSRKKAGA